jgi:primary-amine oxidase
LTLEASRGEDRGPRSTPRHPLDPLSADEISAAVGLLHAARPEIGVHRFVKVELLEPSKQELERAEVERRAELILFVPSRNETYEAVVSLSGGELIRFEHIPGVQPEVVLDEFEEVETVVRESGLYRDALRKRGIEEFDGVCVDPWSAGSWGEDDRGRRLMRALTWIKLAGEDDNLYAHPIDHLVAIVDLNLMEVVEVEDFGIVAVPQEPGNYVGPELPPPRTGLRPITIEQPEGPSFEVDGHRVRWQKWSFHVGFTHREGLVLSAISYRDGAEQRSILHRASLSSMIVPYGDPSPTQHRKNAFDIGEYGLGYLANSLEMGCDCLGEIRYLDAVLVDGAGAPYTIANAICLHEEDDGILWKHTDFRTGRAEVRRSRRLVVSFIATVGNYEYAFYWRFYQDGSIEQDIKLTGIMTTGAIAPGEKMPYGQLLNLEGLYAPNHQHFFNYRLDFAVDGPANTVHEVNTEVPDGPENPYGNAFRTVETPLLSEKRARRRLAPESDRHWKVVNPSRLNAVGEPVAYRLVPGKSTRPHWRPDAHVAPRGSFVDHDIWVTPYAAEERYGAGAYPYQNPDAGGLPEWTEADRPVADTDIVLWYSFGSFHAPRLEDWPVMPVTHAGFRLEPCGFFDANPALDVPEPAAAHCH